MAAHTSPLDLAIASWQVRSREPADGEGEWERVADNELLGHGSRPGGVREWRYAVGSTGVDDATVVCVQVVLGN